MRLRFAVSIKNRMPFINQKNEHLTIKREKNYRSSIRLNEFQKLHQQKVFCTQSLLFIIYPAKSSRNLKRSTFNVCSPWNETLKLLLIPLIISYYLSTLHDTSVEVHFIAKNKIIILIAPLSRNMQPQVVCWFSWSCSRKSASRHQAFVDD